ncbi:MAG: hypothetical protein ACD_75C02031G0001 [uncultured bacterium]|nr:MAG: hypothetical protein ACD_75C02031G0001 [uncultured bacterium]
MNTLSIFASTRRTLCSCSSRLRNSRSTASRKSPRSSPPMALRTETRTSGPFLIRMPSSTATKVSLSPSHSKIRIPGTSAAAQSRRRGSNPTDPPRVSATIRSTPAFLAKTSKGRRILSCISASMSDPRLWFSGGPYRVFYQNAAISFAPARLVLRLASSMSPIM